MCLVSEVSWHSVIEHTYSKRLSKPLQIPLVVSNPTGLALRSWLLLWSIPYCLTMLDNVQGFIHNVPSALPNQFSRGIVDKTLWFGVKRRLLWRRSVGLPCSRRCDVRAKGVTIPCTRSPPQGCAGSSL